MAGPGNKVNPNIVVDGKPVATKKKKSRRKVKPLFMVIILIVIIGVGYFIYANYINKPEPKLAPKSSTENPETTLYKISGPNNIRNIPQQ